MKTTEIVLHVPEISLSAVASAYIDVAAFLFTLAALSYLCIRMVAPMLDGKRPVPASAVAIALFGLPMAYFSAHIGRILDVEAVLEERLEELEEKEKAYDDYFEVEEDAG